MKVKNASMLNQSLLLKRMLIKLTFTRLALAKQALSKKAIWLTLLFSVSHASFAQDSTPDPELTAFLKQTVNESSSFKDKFDAEVWLVDMSGRLERYIKDPKERLRLLKAVHREAKKANLKPDIVLALIQVESAFNQYAVSSVGAQGLMQVMPFWRKEIGREDDNLTDMDTNLRYGCRILQFYLKREKGVLFKALARYNGSVGKTWYPELVFKAWNRRWKSSGIN